MCWMDSKNKGSNFLFFKNHRSQCIISQIQISNSCSSLKTLSKTSIPKILSFGNKNWKSISKLMLHSKICNKSYIRLNKHFTDLVSLSNPENLKYYRYLISKYY